MSETCTRPSTPSSTPTKMPKSVTLRTWPLMTEPIGYLSSSSVQGFGSICFMPSAMRLALGSMSRTTASTSSPTSSTLRRVLDALGPGHLGDVHQALDALLDLDEGAVVGEADHLALDAGADRVLLVGAVPRVLLDLLEAEARRAPASGSNLRTTTRTSSPTLNISRRVADAAPATCR